jgi:hypothetical protein
MVSVDRHLHRVTVQMLPGIEWMLNLSSKAFSVMPVLLVSSFS